MIDEALYQQAADELNSARRRPHIWARACALANDDHDEARYLYTNLRVEELIAEQTSGKGEPGSAAGEERTELELEPVQFDERAPGEEEEIVSVRAGSDTRAEPLVPGARDEGTRRPASEHGRAVLDLDGDSTLDLDPGEVQRLNEASAGSVSAIDGRLLPDADGDGRDDGQARSGELDDDETRRLEPDEKPVAAWDETDGAVGADVTTGGGSGATDGREAGATDTAGSADDDADVAGEGDGNAFDVDDAVLSSDAASDTGSVAAAFWSGEDDADGRALATTPADGDPGREDRAGLVELRSPAERAPASGALDDLDWLDEAYREERRSLAATPPAGSDPADDPDELTRELRRQAEELPGGRGAGAVIPHERAGGDDRDAVIDAERTDDDGVRRVDEADDVLPTRRVVRAGEEAERERADVESGRRSDVHADALAAASAAVGGTTSGGAALGASGDEPLELVDEGAGDEEYAVFARDGGVRYQAVRQGGSWAAMLFTLPWLLYRHLIGTALLYALLLAAVLAGLLVTGFAWVDAGAEVSLATRVAAIGFALLAFAGLVVVPFRSANHWREDKLERRGFELVAYVRARGAKRALELARQRTGHTL